MVRRLLALVLLTLLLNACQPYLSAQNKLDLITVQQAFDNLNQLASYHTTVDATIDQVIDTAIPGLSTRMSIHQVIGVQASGVESGNSSDMRLKMAMNSDMGGLTEGMNEQLNMDVITINGAVYVRMDDTSNSLGVPVPAGWMSGAEASSVTGISDFNGYTSGDISGIGTTTSQYNEQTVRSVARVAPIVIHGQTAQGYRLVLNTDAILADASREELVNMSGLNDLSALGIDPAQMMDDIFKNTEMTITVWVGSQDQLIHVMELVMTMDYELTMSQQGMSLTMSIDQTVSGTTIFSGFNDPVTISAPQ